MTTVIEYTTGEQPSTVLCVIFVGKRLVAKNIHKEIFHVYGGKYLSRKAVHSWFEKLGKRFADDEEFEMGVRKSLRQEPPCRGFRHTGKAMGQVYQCWWRIMSRNKFFFSVTNITCFTFYIHL
jgi:hypothetical protein